MFVLCPHCQFLVAVDARTGLPPAACPKCGGAIVVEAPGEAELAAARGEKAGPVEAPAAVRAPAPVEAATPIEAPAPTPPMMPAASVTPAAPIESPVPPVERTESTTPPAQLDVDAVIAAMSAKPARRSRAKSEDAPKAPRRSRAKPAPSAAAPAATEEVATPAAPARVRPPRAPVGKRIAAWLSSLKPKPKPKPVNAAAVAAPTVEADAAPEKPKATVKPIPSLRERAARRAEAKRNATEETTTGASTAVETPAIELPAVESTAVETIAPPSTEVAAIQPFAVESLTAPTPEPPPLVADAAPRKTMAPAPVSPERVSPERVPPDRVPLEHVPQEHVSAEQVSPPPAPVTPPPIAATSALRTRARSTTATPSFARSRTGARLSMPARWRHIAAIGGLSLLLALQLLLAQRDALAADARWRPTVGALCNVFRCAVPDWRQPEAFTMLSRDVRPHPTAPGTLRIDASFRNDARWAQAWPRLVVSLSDVEGRVVGTRAFSAREYLGAAPTQDTLASGQTAAIHLDVVEPAPGIVAFSFDFR